MADQQTILEVIHMAVLVYILMNYTRLGYETKAVQGSQLITRNSGINIFKHAVECYALAGALVCIAGVLDVSFSTQMASGLGNTSNGVVTANRHVRGLNKARKARVELAKKRKTELAAA